jgi:hypothetical protein
VSLFPDVKIKNNMRCRSNRLIAECNKTQKVLQVTRSDLEKFLAVGESLYTTVLALIFTGVFRPFP